ncbi:TRAP transporter small permease [Paenibacillus naphthalenovorans]|uniref:TRAP transporter small permease n=1 Tax=Paenibacillus naphthalenovorans TaxID=162209 RepID=UPI0008843258|nr:TRAP transporter small permease [Paenibacillus naphthalenovorans]SDH90314.1 TRAP-type C4-dicarboxylate transport system, small permease component [Paenibacillus naphthalenovorans]
MKNSGLKSVTEQAWKVVLTVIAVCFLIGTFLTFVNVVMRKALNKPWIGTEEMDSILLVLLVFLPLAYVEWTNKQLNVSVVFDLFPKKVKFWIRKSHHLLILAVSICLTAASWEVVQRNMDVGNKTASLGIPLYLLFGIIFVGFALTTLTKLVQLFMSDEDGGPHDH